MQQAIKPTDKIIWIHCASLGEFEQGQPVLKQLKQDYPSHKILLTFFSPSGFEFQKDNPLADYIFYLPIDTSSNAKAFYDIAKPKLVIFIKYEFWFYYLREACRRNIPLILVSGIFRKDQPFFKWYGQLHRQMLSFFTLLLVQNENSVKLLQQLPLSLNVYLTGDTRFDRVLSIVDQFEPIYLIDIFCSTSKVVVAGSTWTDDDKELAHYANNHPEVTFIIAPHNITPLRLTECSKYYKHSILFSALKNANVPAGINTLIIDNVGMLSRLYKYATVCYVGGAFGTGGVHNVLEAAVYAKPVVYGPEFEDYAEAVDLVKLGGGITVNTALELEQVFDRLLENTSSYDAACQASYNYVQKMKGATGATLRIIQENRLLTS